MDDYNIIIALIAGAVGGNVAGYLLKDFDLGVLWNSVAGIVGGGIGAAVLAWLGLGGFGGGDVATIVYQVVGGIIGGGVLLVIVGLVMRAFSR